MQREDFKELLPVYCDSNGTVFDYPGFEPAFRTGNRVVRVNHEELIKLPSGSVLFSLPERYPIYYTIGGGETVIRESLDGGSIRAVSSFLSSGYLRTCLPAFKKSANAPVLPLWAYAGVVVVDGEFYVPALRIDPDPRSDPELHQNDDELKRKITSVLELYPENRLVNQLSLCSTEYRCLCARNFFLSRYEAPVPTTPSCNAHCIGCLSFQEDSGFSKSQERLNFKPSPIEIAEVILHHFERVDRAVASFGQGCEGEPLLRAKDLAEAISIVRKKTDRGTININTNASIPDKVSLLIDSGLDSIRISINSPTESYYNSYYRQAGYSFNDVKKSIEAAINSGIFVSLNLFFLPGFTDMETEVNSLFTFLSRFPVNMIQARNLNIDPDFYLDNIGFEESDPIGIRMLLEEIKSSFPHIRIGYYNPPKETFR